MKRVFAAGELDPIDRYKLLTGLVVPRPIGWIGSRGPDGVDNLAPFSFFTMVAGTPPTVLFAPGSRTRVKDTLRNVQATGVFTVNMVTEHVAVAMNLTSGDYEPGVDEFAVAGLTKVEAEVGAPMVGEAKANLECTVTYVHEIGDGPSAAVVFGVVERFHVAEELLDGTRIDFAALQAVGRLAGVWYSRTTDLFDMERPRLD